MTLTRSSKDENPGFHWAFGLNRLSLKIIGIWPSEDKDEPKTAWTRFVAHSVPLMVVGMIVCIIVPQLYALDRVRHDFSLVIDNLTTVCLLSTCTIKLFLLWNSRKLLDPILQLATDHWWRASPDCLAVMHRQARRAKIFTMSGYGIMIVCFVGFMFTPFLGFSVRTLNNITDDIAAGHFLPFQTYYPFDLDHWPVYELVYASQVIAASFGVIGYSVPDNFFGALAFHACAQCQLLSEMIRGLPLATMHDGDDRRAEFRGRLAAFVERHLLVIRFVSLVEKAFNMIILVQTVSLTLIICFLIFGSINSLGSNDNGAAIVQMVTLSGTALNLMIHMFIYCIASELLTEYSQGIADAVYSYDWHLLPSICSRQLVIIMIRTRFPLRFTAGKFFYLSLNAYLNIIKSSAGYISVLLAVQGG